MRQSDWRHATNRNTKIRYCHIPRPVTAGKAGTIFLPVVPETFPPVFLSRSAFITDGCLTAPGSGQPARHGTGGKYESGGAEPRTQRGTTRALVRDGDGTAASLIGRHHPESGVASPRAMTVPAGVGTPAAWLAGMRATRDWGTEASDRGCQSGMLTIEREAERERRARLYVASRRCWGRW